MSRIPDDLAIRYGAILDEFEGALKTLNSSKSSTLEDLRADLRKMGMVGAEISAEIAMLKGAVKLSRMTETERQKSDEKDDGVADYVNILALARARAHVRGDEHDAETGEVIETARELVARGVEAADHGILATSGAAAPLAANPGVEDVAPPPAHAPEQPGTDHGSVSTPDEGGADSSKIHEPVTDPTAVSLPAEVTEAGDDRSAGAPPSAATVVAFRTHNPATHFLNSKGMPRLHGCLNAEACAGSHRALCFNCSVRHEGPAFQGGAA